MITTHKDKIDDKFTNTNTKLLPWSEKYRPGSINNIIYHEKITKAIVNYMELKKLPHLLFYGPPGTGKTSMIKAIANELQRHIHYLNLAVIKNDTELIGLMSRINFKETVLVIEDIDAQGKLVHKRSKEFAQELTPSTNQDNLTGTGNTTKPEEKKPEQTVTLSCLLNQLDGINNNHGMVAILTTNFPEILDEALVRDGRVDEKVFFDYVDHEQIYNMFSNFYNGKNEVTLEIIKTRINFDLYKIAPCNVENSMRRQYANSLKALDDLVESMGSKKSFEKFEI